MRKNILIFLINGLAGIFVLITSETVSGQISDTTKKMVDTTKTQIKSTALGKEEKNRNVMLSAESNIGPRNVNIGLPFQGDVVILENDLPVVYTFWPQNPLSVWRYDNSLGRMGLLSFSESAITSGKVGYAVSSYDRFTGPGKKPKVLASLNLNHFGMVRADANITGPIGNKGWGYTASIYQNFDPGTVNYDFTSFQDRTQIYKIGLSKKFKTGNISVLYKYANSKVVQSAYYPFIYEGDGKTHELPNFRIARDNYIVRDGKIGYYDTETGAKGSYDIYNDGAATTHSLDILGNFQLASGWKLKFSSRVMRSYSPFIIQFPTNATYASQYQPQGYQFSYLDNQQAYTGPVQQVASQYVHQEKINTLLNRIEVNKIIGKNALRIGLQQQYFGEPYFKQSNSIYYQTIEPNPQKLSASINTGSMIIPLTDADGVLAAAKGVGGTLRKNSWENKVALYASNDWTVSQKLTISYAGRLEFMKSAGEFSPYRDEIVGGRPLKEYSYNMWNKVASIGLVYKALPKAGLMAEATYNEIKQPNGIWNTDYTQELKNNQPVKYAAAGVYWNHPLLNIVSKATVIQKNRNVENLTAYNPSNPSESKTLYPVFYDIQTLGWTTDVIATPLKNFDLHFLITLQNPIYKSYNYEAFGTQYTNNGRNIPELSKVLLEIDPSYRLVGGSLRLWASLRYFGKQYSNTSNALYYNGWWETFGGADYRVNRKLDFKMQVVNFLNQRGVKGKVIGADLITDGSLYKNNILTGGFIRPFTVELTANFKF